MIKVDGVWQQVEWQEALDFIQKELGVIIDNDPSQLGALVSPSLTLEELYLSQKLLRGLGSNNIDCRLKQIDFSEQASTPLFPWLGQSIVDFEENQAVFLIGSNVRKDQPIINHRLRKAVVNGASVMVLNPVDYDFNFSLHCKSIVAPNNMVSELASVLRAAVKLSNVAQEALMLGIKQIRPQNKLLDIAGAIEDYVKSNGFSIVEDYTGHGVGRNLHEEPSVFNFRTNDLPNVTLREGMTIAVEPIINLGTKYCKTLRDGWTVITKDGNLSAQWEHTVLVTKNGFEILTDRED